ncbi:RNA polymerase II transcription factor B subunit 4 [Malassezia pachydermatis]
MAAETSPPQVPAPATPAPLQEIHSGERLSPDFLVVVLDLDATAWQHIASDATTPEARADAAFEALKAVISAVLVFINAHSAMQHGNGIALYGAAAGTAKLLYSTSIHAQPFVRQAQDTQKGACLPFKILDDAVFEGMKSLFDASKGSDHGPVGITRALTLALCHMNRMTVAINEASSGGNPGTLATSSGPAVSFRHRILVLSATPDVSAQYVPMMNCIFSAQKQGIHIDVCKLLGDETVFLRQACHLTGGHYYRMTSLDRLLQVLMTAFLPSRSIQPLLMFPALDDVDFRAACFCHRRNVDIGYVCSVCLSSTCLLPC